MLWGCLKLHLSYRKVRSSPLKVIVKKSSLSGQEREDCKQVAPVLFHSRPHSCQH